MTASGVFLVRRRRLQVPCLDSIDASSASTLTVSWLEAGCCSAIGASVTSVPRSRVSRCTEVPFHHDSNTIVANTVCEQDITARSTTAGGPTAHSEKKAAPNDSCAARRAAGSHLIQSSNNLAPAPSETKGLRTNPRSLNACPRRSYNGARAMKVAILLQAGERSQPGHTDSEIGPSTSA